MKQAKAFSLSWIADDGEIIRLGTVISNNPKEALFNCICSMLVLAPYCFKTSSMKECNMKKIIKTGRSKREHYFAEINDQVISILEI